MNTYKHILEQTTYGLFLLLTFLLPYPQVALRFVIVLWFVCWLLEGRWLHKPAVSVKTFIPILLFGLWFAYKVLSVCWVADIGAWKWQMERYMTFALIIPVGIWGVNDRFNWQQVGRVLVLGCTSAVIFYLITMTLLYLHPAWVLKLHISDEWHPNIENPLFFFSENISHIKHRLFLCSVEMMGVIAAFATLRHRKALLIPSVLIMLSTIPLTGSRQSILTATALLAVALVYALPPRYRLRYGVGILLLGILLGGGMLTLHPRMQEFNFRALTQIRDISYTHDIRLNIWGLAIQTPEDYLSHGLGAGQSTGYMIDKYEQYHLDYYIQKHYHPHNQYLEELMEGGIPGLVLFVLAWLSIPLCCPAERRRLAVFFTVLFVINMFTDCMFGMFDGIALWAVGILYSCSMVSNTR